MSKIAYLLFGPVYSIILSFTNNVSKFWPKIHLNLCCSIRSNNFQYHVLSSHFPGRYCGYFKCDNSTLVWVMAVIRDQAMIYNAHRKCLCHHTVYPKKYARRFVVLCFVVVMQSFIMNSHEVFIHIHQGCFADTGAIVRLPQCQRSKPGGYGKISQCITTTKHSKAKTMCIFLGIYCMVSLGH